MDSTPQKEETAARHTPGEWTVGKDGSAYWLPIVDERGCYITAVCERTWRAEAEANANLIAQAPSLLAFLQREEAFLAAVGECVDCEARQPEFCEEHSEGYDEICDARRTIIAKATGGKS